MSTADGIATEVVTRLYGASELGVLTLTAPGDAHPRVQYVGAELFVGLDDRAQGVAVTQGDLPDDGVFHDALRAAIAESDPIPAAEDGWLLIEDESAAAAALLDPARIVAAGVGSEPVVFALARRAVVVVDAADEAALARVADLAEQLFDDGAPLVSAHPMLLTEQGWGPFPWRERHPELAPRFERVLRLFSVRAYDVQGVALERPDVHIAPAKIRVLESGVTTTFATWPKGTATLLPVVDNVIIADPAGQLSVTTMAQFLEAAGDAVVRTGLSPARYFVPGDQPAAASA
ncbi:hypothetical protein [Microbacterium dauci]|uniref:SseB protein N-terminal domain-containing protein n=1 Tax=Microbacterium dauci TaxID=3048008 RepID=A0ABT6ZAX3_9MICO|nr:hypothetical protein [Microbacterium sp. LX3-4]MDJ1112830.1 hypothetical protein [Microbacterium sp. LX3-4]